MAQDVKNKSQHEIQQLRGAKWQLTKSEIQFKI